MQSSRDRENALGCAFPCLLYREFGKSCLLLKNAGALDTGYGGRFTTQSSGLTEAAAPPTGGRSSRSEEHPR
jgi:hypothetical protein